MRNRVGEIAIMTGKIIKGLKGTQACNGVWEGTQLKTEADLIAHREISSRLSDLAPQIPVISEEDFQVRQNTRPDQYWLIDPIDGTASFAEGFKGYVTQIALMDSGRPVISSIYAPEYDQLFSAELGEGAFLNEKRLTVSPRTGHRTLIDNYPQPRAFAKTVYRRLNFDAYMESGSISLKICRIADSSADLFFKDVVVRDWDIAAPHLLLEEAGGYLRLIDGNPIVYKGAYEKSGLVATGSKELINEFFCCCKDG